MEGSIKAERQKEIEDYFAELAAANDIDFLTFKVSNINVTLSASTKSLKEQAKSFVERIAADLETIETQEHKDEILVEYKACLDLSKSITTVANRKKALQEQEERRKAAEEARNKALEEVKPIDKAEAPLQAPKEVKAEAKVKMTFTVRGTMQELKTLKDFLEKGGYDYE